MQVADWWAVLATRFDRNVVYHCLIIRNLIPSMLHMVTWTCFFCRSELLRDPRDTLQDNSMELLEQSVFEFAMGLLSNIATLDSEVCFSD
jgi:hypothetical protein